MSKPKGTIKDALKTDTVKLLETDPAEFVQRTSRFSFGFSLPEEARPRSSGSDKKASESH
ncbi:hypothetical protein [Rhodococcus pyridinivorans]|uniref:hypothetical protein n=1 Tax=Rhodococcus pyridinivorans TaxID=103816 RepID=UPI000587D573|nr:hypothetical protein [Rhodococcus pyridinivorans]MCD2140425.1 hypothetical protein [Rhodococcus pyridinivorans]